MMRLRSFYLISWLMLLACLNPLWAQPTYQLALDKDPSAREGAENLLLIQNLFFRMDNYFIGPKKWEETSFISKAGGVLYRGLQGFYWENVFTDYLFVAQHEIFGHGVRLKEVDAYDITYEITLPPPWGEGGGATSYRPRRDLGMSEKLMVALGGVEASFVMSRRLKMKWVEGQKIPYYQSWLYFNSNLDLFGYIRTFDDPLKAEESHDIASYINTINGFYDSNGYSKKMTQSQLEEGSNIVFFDPFIYLAIWGYVKSYLWSGEHDYSYPMISMGKVDYLPSFQYALTPFGTETIFENYFRFNQKTIGVFFRKGEEGSSSFWGGGTETSGLWDGGSAVVDVRAEVWRQPRIFNGTEKMGMGAWFKMLIPIKSIYESFAISMEAGYKMKGYVAGEPLASGASFSLSAVLIR